MSPPVGRNSLGPVSRHPDRRVWHDASMSGLENIATLHAATATLTLEQDQRVTAYMLGALSNYVDAQTWDRVLGWAVDHAVAGARP